MCSVNHNLNLYSCYKTCHSNSFFSQLLLWVLITQCLQHKCSRWNHFHFTSLVYITVLRVLLITTSKNSLIWNPFCGQCRPDKSCLVCQRTHFPFTLPCTLSICSTSNYSQPSILFGLLIFSITQQYATLRHLYSMAQTWHHRQVSLFPNACMYLIYRIDANSAPSCLLRAPIFSNNRTPASFSHNFFLPFPVSKTKLFLTHRYESNPAVPNTRCPSYWCLPHSFK